MCRHHYHTIHDLTTIHVLLYAIGTLYDKLGLSHAEQAAHHDFHHTVNVGQIHLQY